MEVSALELTDVALPNNIELSWENQGDWGSANWTNLRRESTGVDWTLSLLSPQTITSPYIDTVWSYNVKYKYTLGGTVSGTYQCDQGHTHNISRGVYSTIHATVYKIPVSENQSVDSRLDLRYSVEKPLDFQFGSRAYRGGLFAGFNGDSGRVGRTYLKFGLIPPTDPGDRIWAAGGLSLYFTRLAKNGGIDVQVRRAASNTWNAGSIVWTNAPAPQGNGFGSTALSFNRTATPTGGEQWRSLDCAALVDAALQSGSNTLSLVVQSTNEDLSGWAYFAKKEQDAKYTPHLIYAVGRQAVERAAVSGLNVRAAQTCAFDNVSRVSLAATAGFAVPAKRAVAFLEALAATTALP